MSFFALQWYQVENWIITWAPIIFMGLLVFFLWRTMKLMPKTKPTEITPDSDSAVEWSQVAGADEAKAELQEVVDFLKDPARFKALGASVPKGIMLHGPPGTGKTLLAKAVAKESGAKFYAQSASSFVEMFAGLGAARIRRLFQIARDNRPAIIFIDEIDAVGGERGSDNNSEREQTLNQLLVEMDGFRSSGDLVVIAASNLLDKLDPALLRPGRFDRQIFVSPPDVAGREAIMRVHTESKPLADDVDLEILARQTSGLTGADLANLCNEAAIFAVRSHREAIAQTDFDAALERVVAGMQSRRTLNEHERRVVAFHEAGHALCAELLPGVNRVHKISIVPRGKALGYTLNLPEEDRYLKTKEELIDYMSVLLGGRAAEELVFGSITTGAADDLHRVAEISRSMVHDYAMGTSITSRKVSAEGGQVSDRTRQLRDEEQQHLSDEAMRGRDEADLRPPHQARPARERAAAQRGARAQGHRPDHGGRPALPPVARPGPAGGRRGPHRRRPALGSTGANASRTVVRGASSSTPAGRCPRRWQTAPPPVRRRPARSTTSASCSHPGRSARSSSRSSGSPTCSRSATRAWPASPRRPGLVALPPDVTLAAAGRLGVREDLEVACWAAISEAGAPPAGRLLFVNVAPDALGHPGLLELAERLPARLVIELTEQDAVQNTVQLRERLRPWIARGALVAVDDAGAGFTSLEYVADLRPDFLKLCRGMVTGVDLDPSRQAVLRATVAFAREVGARIVAEGVERPEELAILRDAEVDYGQGWLFGRPAEAWPEEPSARPSAPPRPPSGRLERELAAATSAREASEAIVEHLARKGLMPSVYLEDGGRLRCQAVRGYWQIYDGMPATAGVIGRTFRTGEATIVDDVAASADYLLAVASVHAEVCVPLRVRGRRRRRAQRRVADRARRRRRSPRSALRRAALGAPGGARRDRRGLARPAARAHRRAARLARGRRGHRPRDGRRRPRAGRLRVRDARAPRRPRRLLRPPRGGPVRRRARRARGAGARADRRLGRQRAPRATPPATAAGAASRATRCCARPAPTP